ncbi:hypothetical protein Tco_1260173, partial [Tanacetum coccineum]
EDIINLLRLEGPLADPFRISDLQPDVEQLRVPTHRSDNQVVLGETSLSFTLSVSRSRVVHINENIAGQRVPASVVTTTTLSTTFASASSIPLITIEDYEISNTDGQEGGHESGQGDVQGDAQGVRPLLPPLNLKRKS